MRFLQYWEGTVLPKTISENTSEILLILHVFGNGQRFPLLSCKSPQKGNSWSLSKWSVLLHDEGQLSQMEGSKDW